MNNRLNSRGFTIIELLIATGLSAFIILLLLTITVQFWMGSFQQATQAELAIEGQALLRQMTEDTRFADSVLSSNSISDANKTGGWTTFDGTNPIPDVLILATPTYDTSRNFIYDTSTGSPYNNEIVFFGSGTSIYKRTLKNTGATGNTAITTCPAASATATCPADILLTSNLSSLTFTFYDASDVVTTTAGNARAVKLDIVLGKKVFGQTMNVTQSIKVALRN